MFLPHFDVFCDLLLNRSRRTATWNLFVLYNNEENALFISKSFNVSSKAGLCGASAHFGEYEKKPFDVVYCLYKMEQSHWLLCVAKNYIHTYFIRPKWAFQNKEIILYIQIN